MGEILPDGSIQGYTCAHCGQGSGFYGHYRNGEFYCLPLRPAVEVRLAMALARWVLDDPDAEDEEVSTRAAAFLDTGDTQDVVRILAHVPHDETTEFVVDGDPAHDTEGGQGFMVNGIGFAVEYQHEGSGIVQPSATWRPACVICGEPVQDFHDEMCRTCEAEPEVDLSSSFTDEMGKTL